MPLALSASDPLRESFIRVINHSHASGKASIYAIDDAGARFGPITLWFDARQTRHFNSRDLETGNLAKGLTGAIGGGTGHWRLTLESALDLETLAYIRTNDGFLTNMHDLVPEAGRQWRLSFFNAASNINQRSALRLINPGEVDARVRIQGLDDMGNQAREEVTLTLPAGQARMVWAQQLENGADGLNGRFGDGAGKWQVTVTADQPIEVMNLLESPTDKLANLSTASERRDAPLFLSASTLGRESFARIINRSNAPGTVSIQATDDAGNRLGPVTLALEARQTRHFNSNDLETGNAEKGLSGGVGAGHGDLRLQFDSGLDIEVAVYIRTTDGFVTSMHELALKEAGAWRVPFFNPARNINQRSLLRLVNSGENDATVTVQGLDDRGILSSVVELALDAGRARTISAPDLESGATDLEGSFVTGVGKRQLFVAADQPLRVMGLLESPTGDLANLSATVGERPGGDGFGLLREGNDDPEGIVYAEGKFYVADFRKVYAYFPDGRRDPVSDFDLTAANFQPRGITYADGNSNPAGIAYADGKFYVADQSDRDVYAYFPDGRPDPSSDFDVAMGYVTPSGLTYADGKLHVVNNNGGSAANTDNVETYFPDGRHDPSGDFDLAAASNTFPIAITYADGKFYVVDEYVNEVFAYFPDGRHDPGSSFDLAERNFNPAGIAYADGKFHVPHLRGGGGYPPQVFSYFADGRHDPDGGFLLADNNSSPTGITYANDKLYVINRHPNRDRVHAYFADGGHDPGGGFDLADDNSQPQGIIYVGDKFYVVDEDAHKVFAYFADGRHDPDGGFDLDRVNTDPLGITHVNGKFYVADQWDFKVYAYFPDGSRNRAPGDGFDLTYGYQGGITYANDKLYIIIKDPFDEEANKAEAYFTDGGPDFSSSFDLADDNLSASGTTYANGKFYVVDSWTDNVYAYFPDGRHDPGGDFDLTGDPDLPEGITFADGKFYVVTRKENKVYAYFTDGRRDFHSDFGLRAENAGPQGITYADGKFYVADANDTVYIYTPD